MSVWVATSELSQQSQAEPAEPPGKPKLCLQADRRLFWDTTRGHNWMCYVTQENGETDRDPPKQFTNVLSLAVPDRLPSLRQTLQLSPLG